MRESLEFRITTFGALIGGDDGAQLWSDYYCFHCKPGIVDTCKLHHSSAKHGLTKNRDSSRNKLPLICKNTFLRMHLMTPNHFPLIMNMYDDNR